MPRVSFKYNRKLNGRLFLKGENDVPAELAIGPYFEALVALGDVSVVGSAPVQSSKIEEPKPVKARAERPKKRDK